MDTVSFFNFLRKNVLVNPFSRDLSHPLQKWLHGRLRRVRVRGKEESSSSSYGAANFLSFCGGGGEQAFSSLHTRIFRQIMEQSLSCVTGLEKKSQGPDVSADPSF